jgi:uncharacterized protein
MIIDGDGHFVEPASMWADYIDPGLREQIRVDYDTEGSATAVHVGALTVANLRGGPASPWWAGDGLTPGGTWVGRARHRRLEDAHPGGWDARERLKVHDAEGIDAAVLFATFGLFLGPINDRELAIGVCQAVNRFAADYCAAAPQELFFVAVLPLCDPNAAAAELRRAVRDDGAVGASVRPNRSGPERRTLGDPAWEPLWLTAAELDVPVCIHNVLRDDLGQAGIDRSNEWYVQHSLVHPIEGMLAFGSMFECGVFDRHPDTRFGFLESGCGWLPYWMDRLHEHHEHYSWAAANPPKRDPLEIFSTQCGIGCESEDPFVGLVQGLYGDESVMWASDFPHTDSSLPGLATQMLARTDLSPSQKDGAMHRATASFFGLDTATIAASNTARRGTDSDSKGG